MTQKSKIMKLDNLNLVNIDEDNIDEVLILEKEDYYKKLTKLVNDHNNVNI